MRRAVIEMLAELGLESGDFVGMHTGEPLVGLVTDVLLSVSQHLLPARREVNLSLRHPPIPEPSRATWTRQRVPFLALAKRRFGAPALLSLGRFVEGPADGGRET